VPAAMSPKSKGETKGQRRERKARAKALDRLANETFGLSLVQRRAIAALSTDTMAYLTTMATADGLELGKRHSAMIAKLQDLGFLEIQEQSRDRKIPGSAINGHRPSTAKLTRAGLSALVSRLKRYSLTYSPTRK
jgi:hypothetical protein